MERKNTHSASSRRRENCRDSRSWANQNCYLWSCQRGTAKISNFCRMFQGLFRSLNLIGINSSRSDFYLVKTDQKQQSVRLLMMPQLNCHLQQICHNIKWIKSTLGALYSLQALVTVNLDGIVQFVSRLSLGTPLFPSAPTQIAILVLKSSNQLQPSQWLEFLGLVGVCSEEELLDFKTSLPFIIIQQMKEIVLFLFLLALACTQIITLLPNSLQDIARTVQSQNSLQAKAVGYLLSAHPELSNYTVSNMSSQIDRSNQPYASNFRDFLFQLLSANDRIRVMVTLSDLAQQSYTCSSAVVSASPKNKTSGQIEYIIWTRATISTGESNSINTASTTNNNVPLNSFTLYQHLNDPLVQFAIDYLASLHPNLLNYQIKDVYYQLVAGLNIKIIYLGHDQYSQIVAVVNFDLKLTPNLIDFELDCIKHDDYCNPLAAWDIYQSVQSILIFHPELFGFRLVETAVQSKIVPGTAVRVRLTFESAERKLQTQVEQQVELNKATILSFYTYAYERQTP